MFVYCLLFLPVQVIMAAGPEGRAIAYLAREVPRWASENHCYSCHNNGDGARALYAARRQGFLVPGQALHATNQLLTRVERWDADGRVERQTDKPLVHIQFAQALREAAQAGVLNDPRLPRQAADLLVVDQDKAGCWKVDADAVEGTPVTYGAVLATAQACRLLRATDAERYRAAVTRAETWLLQQKPARVVDAAALLLALDGQRGDVAAAQRRRCRELLERAQGKDGGWGPYRNAASEPFDTALALLALASDPSPAAKAQVRRGRAYLLATQREEGNWPETTRPAGNDSYAERISTAAWATLALLETRGR